MKAWAVPLSLMFGTATLGARAEPAHALATLALARSGGAESCIAPKALMRAVERRLGRRVFVSDAADLRLSIQLDATPGPAWRARLTLHDGIGRELGRRELVTEAPDCSALDASLALVVALLLDAPPEPPPAPTPATETAAPPPPAAPPVAASLPPTAIRLPKDTDAPRTPWRIGLALSGALAIGSLPGVAPGGAVSLELGPPRFATILVFAELFPPRASYVESTTNRGVRVSLQRAGILVCPLEHAAARVRVAACAGELAGRSAAEAFGFDENERVSGFWFSLQAGAVASLRLVGPLALRAAALAEAAITRNGYVAQQSNGAKIGLFRAAPIAFDAQIGVGVEL